MPGVKYSHLWGHWKHNAMSWVIWGSCECGPSRRLHRVHHTNVQSSVHRHVWQRRMEDDCEDRDNGWLWKRTQRPAFQSFHIRPAQAMAIPEKSPQRVRSAPWLPAYSRMRKRTCHAAFLGRHGLAFGPCLGSTAVSAASAIWIAMAPGGAVPVLGLVN